MRKLQKKLSIFSEGIISLMVTNFLKIREEMGKSFCQDMQDIRTQGLRSPDDYFGYYKPLKKFDFLAGGLAENVLENTFYGVLNCPISDAFGQRQDIPLLRFLYPSLLKEAMKRNPDLDLFIKSLVSGATKVGNFKNTYNENDILQLIK